MLTSARTRQNFQAQALGDFHDRVSSAARAWGHKFSSEAMHVYMGENSFSLWSYHVFNSIQLSFDIYRVSNHHLIHDIHQMIGGLHNLYKFQWAITSCLSYVEYCKLPVYTLPPDPFWSRERPKSHMHRSNPQMRNLFDNQVGGSRRSTYATKTRCATWFSIAIRCSTYKANGIPHVTKLCVELNYTGAAIGEMWGDLVIRHIVLE